MCCSWDRLCFWWWRDMWAEMLKLDTVGERLQRCQNYNSRNDLLCSYILSGRVECTSAVHFKDQMFVVEPLTPKQDMTMSYSLWSYFKANMQNIIFLRICNCFVAIQLGIKILLSSATLVSSVLWQKEQWLLFFGIVLFVCSHLMF